MRDLTGTTYPAANNLVSRLAERGIIQEMTGYKRNRLFRYEPYIALFGEDPPAEPAHKPPAKVPTRGRILRRGDTGSGAARELPEGNAK